MFEAYSVAVRVSLINGVSAGLLGMIRQFRAADVAAMGLQRRLKTIGGLMLVGGAMTGAGLGIFAALKKASGPAEEYARALNRLRMAGLSQVEIAQAVAGAWKNTGDVMTTTATQNVSALLDLRNILGSMSYATRELPMISKIGTVLSSASEGKITPGGGQNLAFSMAKALDIIGAARDPATFEREAGMMAKSITAFQGRVTPKMFQSVFQYARQSKFDLSDDFKYKFLPTLMLEMSASTSGAGGGSRGVGPMMAALYRLTNQGYISKKALPYWESLGLIQGKPLKTTTTMTQVGGIVGHQLAAQNIFDWTEQVLVPAMAKKLGPKATPDQYRNYIGHLTAGNQLAGSALMEFYSKPQNFYRDKRILEGAMNYNDAYQVAMKNDPALSRQAMGAQWNNFLTAFGPTIVVDMVSIMRTIAPLLHDAAMALEKNPGQAKAWVRGLETLAGVLTVAGGATMLVGVAKAIGLFFDIFKPLAAAGGWLLRLPIVGAALAPLGEAFTALGAAILSIPADGVLIIAAGILAVGTAIYEAWRHWDSSKSVFANLKSEIGGFLDWLTGEGSKVPRKLTPQQQSAQAAAQSGQSWDPIKLAWDAAQVVGPAMAQFWSGFSSTFSKDWNDVSAKLKPAWDGLKKTAGGFLDWLTTWIARFENLIPTWMRAAPKAPPAAARPSAQPAPKGIDWKGVGAYAADTLFGKTATSGALAPLAGIFSLLHQATQNNAKAIDAASAGHHKLADTEVSISKQIADAVANLVTRLNQTKIQINLDGRVIATAVSDQQGRNTTGPHGSRFGYDPRVSLPSPSQGYTR